MKRLLLIYIFLAFLHSFSADGSQRISPKRAAAGYLISSDSIPFASDAFKLQMESAKGVCLVKKDSEQGFSADFQIKRKATELEYTQLSIFYLFRNVLFEYDSGRDFFGLTSLYSIRLHGHLHRYQLF